MPIPFILGALAAVAGVGGVAAGVSGASKMKEAKEIMESAKDRHERSVSRFETQNKTTMTAMDALGKRELEILESFQKFTSVWERIRNKPEFKSFRNEKLQIAKFTVSDIQDVSVGAAALMGSLGGAAMGTLGGVAASSATTAAVMAFGAASTGTAIGSLSGAAATNATLAFLGGGALAAGGGGVALGTAILGGATLGVGLLVGGAIFSLTGSSTLEKAEKASRETRREEKKVNEICAYLQDLQSTADKYMTTLSQVDQRYEQWLSALERTVNSGKTEWTRFTEEERLNAQNTVMAVSLLYEMCKVKLVRVDEQDQDKRSVNYAEINPMLGKVNTFIGGD